MWDGFSTRPRPRSGRPSGGGRVENPSHIKVAFNFVQGWSFVVLLFLACAAPEPARRLPRRIVSLAPNVTEILFALGAGDRVVGTDDFSDEPARAKSLPKVGGVQPDVEKIVALKPDLVIANAAGLHPNVSRAMAAVHVPLLVVRNERLADVAVSMRRIASALAVPSDRAEAELGRALGEQRRMRARAPRVMLAVWTDPLYVAGRETFTDDLFLLAGATNAVTVMGWPQYSLEAFIAAPPDILIVPNRSVTPAQAEALMARARTPNVKVVFVDENVFTRPGPRVGEAARLLNAILDAWEKR
jgi:iron complex transport system substrate-binding protein